MATKPQAPYAHLSDALDGTLLDTRIQARPKFYYRELRTRDPVHSTRRAHRCPGAALTRMEIKLTAREIVRQLTDFRLLVPVDEIRLVPTIATHPIAELPFAFRRRD